MKAEKAPPWIKLVEAYELTGPTEQGLDFDHQWPNRTSEWRDSEAHKGVIKLFATTSRNFQLLSVTHSHQTVVLEYLFHEAHVDDATDECERTGWSTNRSSNSFMVRQMRIGFPSSA